MRTAFHTAILYWPLFTTGMLEAHRMNAMKRCEVCDKSLQHLTDHEGVCTECWLAVEQTKCFYFKSTPERSDHIGIDAASFAHACKVYRKMRPHDDHAFWTTCPSGNLWRPVWLRES